MTRKATPTAASSRRASTTPKPPTLTQRLAASQRRERRAVKAMNSLRSGPGAPQSSLEARHKVAETSRLRKDLRAALGSGDYQNWLDREKVMNVSRALDQRSTVYEGFLNRLVDLTIGSGLMPVGNNPVADLAVDAFNAWAGNSADARKMETFNGLQRHALRAALCDGDILCPLTRDRTIQLIEADRVVSPAGKRMPTTDHAEGVDLDVAGAPRAFHIAEYTPGQAGVSTSTTTVPAEQAVFIACRKRASQTRGMPVLAAGLDRLLGLDQFHDAVDVAAQLQAAMALVVTSKMSQAQLNQLQTGTQSAAVSGDGETTGGSGANTRTMNLLGIEPGAMLFLEPDEDAKGIQGTQPSTTFELYVSCVLRLVAAGLGMPVEVALGDFSKANFSVSRMALTQAQNAVRPLREYFRERFCRRIYEWQVKFLVLTGQIKGVKADDPRLYDVKWLAPARVSIEPLVEANANKLEVENNFTTLRDILEAKGQDYDAVLAQRQKEVRDQAQLGITPPTTPGSQTAADQSSGQEPNGKGPNGKADGAGGDGSTEQA